MGLILLTGRNRGLLDTYSSASGFSLRQIKGNYRECLTIRRSSDSTEATFGFVGGLVDIAGILSFCGSGNGFVRRWYNVDGTNHAEQSAGNLQPRIVNSGALEVNEHGKPVIRFIDPAAVGIGAHLICDPFYTASQAYVAIYSAYHLVSAGNIPHLVGSDPLDRGLVSTHNGSLRQVRTATIRSSTSVANGSALTLGTTYVRLDTANRNDLRTYLNKTEAADIDTADNDSDFVMPTKLWIGNTNTGGTITNDFCASELLFDTSYFDDELTIRSNVYDYWGVA